MRILLLGDIDNKWVKEYLEFVLLPLGHETELLGDARRCRYRDFYAENNIKINEIIPPSRPAARIPYVRIISSVSRTLRKNRLKPYDIIINMFVNARDLMITGRLAGRGTKTVLYFAGSDLLRQSKMKILSYRGYLRRVDRYVVGSRALLADFARKYGAKQDACLIHFGISAFDSIDRYIASHPARGEGFNFCVGYNGSPAHRQLKVLELFRALPPELKAKVRLVLPMTYGADAGYVAQVGAALEASGIPGRILTDFLDRDGMAELWGGVDFFINAQTTDSLSASVLECMYSGCTVINPEWLRYPEYEDLKLRCITYRDFDALGGVIVGLLNGSVRRNDASENRSRLRGAHCWDAARAEWERLFASLSRPDGDGKAEI